MYSVLLLFFHYFFLCKIPIVNGVWPLLPSLRYTTFTQTIAAASSALNGKLPSLPPLWWCGKGWLRERRDFTLQTRHSATTTTTTTTTCHLSSIVRGSFTAMAFKLLIVTLSIILTNSLAWNVTENLFLSLFGLPGLVFKLFCIGLSFFYRA